MDDCELVLGFTGQPAHFEADVDLGARWLLDSLGHSYAYLPGPLRVELERGADGCSSGIIYSHHSASAGPGGVARLVGWTH